MKKTKQKIIVIVGPTSSGKSELAVKLAKKMDGEIISADSRQVYKGMDIGSGKVAGKVTHKQYLYKGVVHFGIDIASTRRQYSAADFQKYAKKKIADICSRGHVPIICGGSGHWIDAVVFGQSIPAVKPNLRLRRQLEKLSTSELFSKLKGLDKARAKTIDKSNPRRLIRALEIIIATGKPVPKLKEHLDYHPLWLGIDPGIKVLDKRIEKRLLERLEQGMVKEVRSLRKAGLSWKHLEGFGLEYKYVALHLQKKLTYEEMYGQLLVAIKQYSKRQRTWWKRNKAIKWNTDDKTFLGAINF